MVFSAARVVIMAWWIGSFQSFGRVVLFCGCSTSWAPWRTHSRVVSGKRKPSKQITTPTLLLQGERDTFGSRAELADFPFSPAVSVHWLTDGDHGFKPRKASGLGEQDNLREAAERIRAFVSDRLAHA